MSMKEEYRGIMLKIMMVIGIVGIVTLACVHTSAYAFLINGTEQLIETKSIFIKHIEFIPLVYICEAFGVSYRWESLTSTVKLYNKGSLFTLLVHEDVADVDGTITTLQASPHIVKGTLMVPTSILDLSWWSGVQDVHTIDPGAMGREFIIDSIVIDPGHGGKDVGAISKRGLREKELVLEMAQLLRKELE